MSKTNLQSTTHGGGRVVSVILAGTLAFGMTPAVALTTQSLEPMQAFAAVDASITIMNGDQEASSPATFAQGTSYTVDYTVTGTDADAGVQKSDYKLLATKTVDDTTTNVADPTSISEVGTYNIYVVASDATETTDAIANKQFVIQAASTTDPDEGDDTSDTKPNIGALQGLKVTYTDPTSSTTYTLSNGETAKIVVASANAANLADAVSTALGNVADSNVAVSGTEGAVTTANYSASAANGYITITGEGIYGGSIQYPYELVYTFGAANVTANGAANLGTAESGLDAGTYNGKAQVPTIAVSNPATGQPMTSGYKIAYQVQNADGVYVAMSGQPTNAGDYRAVVTCDGYDATTQSVYVYFTIAPLGFDTAGVFTVQKVADLSYTGETLPIPPVTITANLGDAGVVTLVKDVDYEVAIQGVAPTDTPATPAAFKETGTYKLVVTGKAGGNYTGTLTPADVNGVSPLQFAVKGISIADAVVTVENEDELLITPDNENEGVLPELKVTLNGEELSENDYTVNPALAKIKTPAQNILYTITGANDYAGSVQKKVNVLRSVEFCSLPGGKLADGNPDPNAAPAISVEYGAANSKTPAIQVKYGTTVLTEGTDYSIEYGENTGAGPEAGSYTITGIGNGWGGSVEGYYEIKGTKAYLENVVVDTDAIYDGTVQNPADFVTFDVYTLDAAGKKVPVDEADYTYTVRTNREFKDAGSYSFTIQLMDCEYDVSDSGTNGQGTKATGTISIAKADLSKMAVASSEKTYLATNNAAGVLQAPKPAFTTTLNGADYALTANDVTITYSGTDADGDEFSNQTALPADAVGEVVATLKGANNFGGTKTVKFNVYQNIANLVYDEVAAVTYNGAAQTPEFKVYANKAAQTAKTPLAATNGQLGTAAKTNYTVAYVDNINAGIGKIVLTGTPAQGSIYAGTLEIPFTINKAAATIAVADIADVTYTGSAITPEPKATITAGTQTVASTFAYSYANNVNAGTATVTVVPTGVGANYDVAATTKSFKINAANMSAVAYSGDTKVAVNKQPTIKLTYNGKELVAGTDYDVTETPVTSKAGKATLKVTGKGNFTGVKTIEITVEDASTPVNPDKPTTTEGWKHNSTGWWYETGEGSYVTSAWKKINGNWYYFNKSGYMMTGWQKINGTWYYLNKKGEGTEGAMVSNAWKKINGAWYNFDKNGAMRTGWYKENGIWYYLNKAGEGTEGKMVANQWKQINGSWFFFHSGGAMATSQYVGPYWVDANGYWVR